MNTCFSRRCLPLMIFKIYLLFTNNGDIQAQALRIANTSKHVGNGRYDWKVYVDTNDSVLHTIKKVEYILHPSFDNPIRVVHDRKNKFALYGNGWGEFKIYINILDTMDRITYVQHWLTLRQNSHTIPKVDSVSHNRHGKIKAMNTSSYIGNDRWNWTAFIISDSSILNDIHCVEYTLHPSFPKPLQKVCDRGSQADKGFFLSASGWGIFTIGINVFFVDGNAMYLEHKLTFSDQVKQR